MVWAKKTNNASKTGSAATTTKHNHAPNFGRHVEGCPRCEEIKNGAPVVKWNIKPSKPAYKHICDYRCGPVCTYGEW